MLYKITSPDLKSLSASGLSQVQYSTEEFVSAPNWLAKKGYHLAVFDAVVHMQWHLTPYSIFDYKIWEAEARGPVRKIPRFCDLNNLAEGIFEEQVKQLYGTTYFPVQFPIGTVFFKEVKLIKEVKV